MASIGAVALAAAVVVVGGWLVRPAAAVPGRLLSGGMVYLASSDATGGGVSIVDAVTARELASVSVGPVGHGFRVVGGWRDGFGIDAQTGRVLRVDGRDLQLASEVLAGEPDAGMAVVAGRGAAYVVRPGAGVVEVIDGLTARVVTVPVEDVAGAVLRDADRAWVLSGDRVRSIGPDGRGQTGQSTELGPGVQLVVAGGRPFVVDATGRVMVEVERDSLEPSADVAGPGGGQFVVGTDTGWVVAVDPAALTVFGIEAGADISLPFELDGAERLGAPASLEGLVYVPGTSRDGSSAIWIIDPRSGVVTERTIGQATGELSLSVQQGLVWWTDGTTVGQGSIGPDGSLSEVVPASGGDEVLRCTYEGDPTADATLRLAAYREDREPVEQIRWEFRDDANGPASSEELRPTVSWRSSGQKHVVITTGSLTTVCIVPLDEGDDASPATTQPTADTSASATLTSSVPEQTRITEAQPLPTASGTATTRATQPRDQSDPVTPGIEPESPLTEPPPPPPPDPPTVPPQPPTVPSQPPTVPPDPPTVPPDPPTVPPQPVMHTVQVSVVNSGGARVVSGDFGRISCPTRCSASYAEGATVQLVVVGGTLTFTGGDCDGRVNDCSFTVTSSHPATIGITASGS